MVNIGKPKQEKANLHFFIIDSDTQFVNKLSRNLNSDPDYEIDTFHDKKEFLDYYHSDLFSEKKDKMHVIIIDSGQLVENKDFELIKEIKTTHKNAEVILLTDQDNSDYVSEAIKLGVYATIPKNDNIQYRIENTAQGIKSLKIFLKKKRTMKITLYAFLGLIVLTVTLYFLLQLTR